MNSHLTYHATLARIDDQLRQAASARRYVRSDTHAPSPRWSSLKLRIRRLTGAAAAPKRRRSVRSAHALSRVQQRH